MNYQGLRGEVRTNEEIISWEKKYGISIDYVKKSDTLYIRTGIGCWKIFWKEEEEKYFLYHRNTYDKKISFGQAINGEYHRQKDVKPTSSIHKLIHYIVAHDKAKQVIQDDYRKLPQSTKKQKKYYRQVKKKVQRNTLKHTRLRMDALFKSIESQDPSLYRLSLC